MYLSHYQLTCKPFKISSDPKFLWLGEKHKEAFAILKYCILDNKGFLLLTGDVGTGKTTLINALVNSLGSDVIVATVPDPKLSLMDFLNYIADAFEAGRRFESKGEFLLYFKDFLYSAYQDGKKVLLIIDEAQRLDHDLLEEVRVLSNIEKQSTKLLNIFFVGQDELNSVLNENRNRAVRQRITINYHVDTLAEEEVRSYIEHRLKVAGTEEAIFSKEAIREIAIYSNGFPRTVNIICDHALLTGFVKGSRKIDGEVIRECAKELHIAVYPEGNRSDTAEKRLEMETLIEKANGLSPIQEYAPRRQGQRISVALSILAVALALVALFFYFSPSFFSSDARTPQDRLPESRNPSSVVHDDLTPSVSGDHMDFGSKQTDAPLVDDDVFSSGPDAGAGGPSPEEGLDLTRKIVVSFPHNSNEFSAQDRSFLDDVARRLKKEKDLAVTVTGYTDSLGSDAYNQRLSLERAKIVEAFLLEQGVDTGQVNVTGKGDADPLQSNETPEGRRLNRRVEVAFFRKTN